jgi:hypothetical protein
MLVGGAACMPVGAELIGFGMPASPALICLSGLALGCEMTPQHTLSRVGEVDDQDNGWILSCLVLVLHTAIIRSEHAGGASEVYHVSDRVCSSGSRRILKTY